jgi:hypothetical protein
VYFPQILEWSAKLDSKLVCDFLERWPSLEELQKVPTAELKKFFRHRRGRHGELTEWRMQGIGQAMPAIRDRAVIEAKQTVVQVIAQLLRNLMEGIATLDRKIAEAAEVHPDYFIFQSLPGAGAALAPRLLAALGSQRDRGRGTEIQRDSAGNGEEREEEMGALPLGVFQILATEFSRMGGTLDRAVGLGACLLPATARAGQGTPCRGEGVSLQMDSYRVSLLARPCGL